MSLDLHVVLVEPKGAANIGSVARVMKNFGAHGLRIVSPRTDHLGEEARNMAVSAVDLLEAARVYKSLDEALADVHLAVATTRRFGRYREDIRDIHEEAVILAGLPAAASAALVFGREEHGLATAEIDLCQHLATIPAAPELPSLNLAQAVAVCLYEIARQVKGCKTDPPPPRDPPATGRELEQLYGHLRDTLLAIGFLDPANPEHILRVFRRIFGRSGLNSREVRVLRGMLSEVDRIRQGRGIKSPSPREDGSIQCNPAGPAMMPAAR